MTVLDGSDNFWHEMFRKDTSEEETKFQAGAYLRRSINELALHNQPFINITPQLDEENKAEVQLNPSEILAYPQNSFNLERNTEKSNNKRKFSQFSQKNLEYMITSRKTPTHSPNKTPGRNSYPKKRTITNSYRKKAKEQPAQNKILVNLRKFEEEQTSLHEKINELQLYISELIEKIDDKSKNLNSLIYENQILRETVESQRVRLHENNSEAMREYEKSTQIELKIQELEEIIQHQNEQAQIRLKQLEHLQEENSVDTTDCPFLSCPGHVRLNLSWACPLIKCPGQVQDKI